MTNAKSTKHALLTSVMALFLCFTMLLGTTFAWFTDTVKSGNNIITAGNLDIELEYKKVVNGVETDWETVGGKDNIFDKKALWEPGRVEVVYLKVSNLGSLALKYQLGVNVVEETPGINVDNETFKLSDYLVFKVVEMPDALTTYTDREAVAIAAGSELGLKDYNGKTTALDAKNGANDEDYVALIVYMPETVGNKANYRGTQVPEIKLGINLYATQLVKEEDSFGPDYDEDAVFGTYVEVAENADLLAAMASAKADEPLTVKLLGDVEWPTEGHHGVNNITPASSIVINGNGYTITATGSGVTPLGDDVAPMTLKNVKIVDNSVSYNESAWELSYLEVGGKELNCVNVEFVDPIQVVGENAIFTNCSFVGHNDKITSTSQYGVWIYNGNATYTNCTFTGTRSMKICDQYAGEVGVVVIDGCIFDGIFEKHGICIDDEDAQDMNITIKNNTFINCTKGIYETNDTVPTLDNNKIYNNATTISTAADLAALNAKAFTGNNNVAEEAIVIINADIDMQGAEFSAMIAQRGDKLTIVGNGHKISNVNVVSGANDNTTGQASMFYAYPNSTLTISDLTLENITATAEANATGYAATVIGYCEGNAVLNNVDVVNATVTGVKSSGLLIGHLSGSVEATDCDVTGTVTLADFAEEANGHYAGKYIGTLAGAASFTNCTVNATVSGNLNAANIGDIYGRKTPAGSITGGVAFGISTAEQLFAFANDVNVNGNNYSGKTVVLTNDIDLNNSSWTPIGQTGATEFMGIFDGQGYTIKNLNVDSSAQTGEHYSSGLFGWVEGKVTIKNVNIDGATVKGNHNVAALLGYTYSARISNCHVSNATIVCNHANGDACGDKAGTVVGYAGNESRFTNCSASDSTVTAGRDAGQLIGTGYNVSVSGCSVNNVTVSATGDCNRVSNINNAVIGRVMG